VREIRVGDARAGLDDVAALAHHPTFRQADHVRRELGGRGYRPRDENNDGDCVKRYAVR
jgi:hypothetical protein